MLNGGTVTESLDNDLGSSGKFWVIREESEDDGMREEAAGEANGAEEEPPAPNLEGLDAESSWWDWFACGLSA